MRAQGDVESILVLAQVDDGLAGQEQAAGEPRARPREGPDLGVGRRNQQIHALARDHAPQGREVVGMRQRGHEVVSIGGRFLEQEAIAVTADDRERTVSGPEAAAQVAGRGASGSREEQASPHGRPTLTAICRLANARRMVSS